MAQQQRSPSQPILRVSAKVLIFLIALYVSIRHVLDYWYIGPVFGTVILVWHAPSMRNLVNVRCGAFLVASTLIYALVVRTFNPDFWEPSPGTNNLYLAVAVGTILLPLAHALFLHASWRRLLVAIPGIYGVWCLVSILAEKLDFFTRGPAGPVPSHIASWQIAYLVFLFAKRPKRRNAI